MTRGARRASGDLHARLHAWLVDGGASDPPRDVAVHAAFCAGCRAEMAAIDALTEIDTGLAPSPATRSASAVAGRGPLGAARAGAATIVLLVLAAGGGLAASGVLQTGAEIPDASATPIQQVLGGALHTESAVPAAGDSVEASHAATASDRASAGPSAGSAFSSAPVTGSTPVPATARALPSGRPSATPRPSSGGSSTAAPSVAPTSAPTPPPTAAPTPAPDDCEDGLDNDGDTLIDIDDPGCLLDGDEPSA